MKIAFFSDCYLDLTGGIVTSIDNEKAELERRGHTVYVFSSAYPRSSDDLERLAARHIFPVPSCRHFFRKTIPIARRPRIVERWIIKNCPELKNFDVYYIHYEAGCSIAGLRLAQKYHIPALQYMHGREDIGEEKLIPYGLRTLVATLLNWFHSWYLPHHLKVKRDDKIVTTRARAKMWTLMVNHASSADMVMSPSSHFRDLLVRYGVSKPVVALHHGVPDEMTLIPVSPRFLAPTRPLQIIWHSRVSSEKRILPFLRALNLLNEKVGRRGSVSPYHLAVYGDGVDLAAAKSYAAKHRLNVTFRGVAPQATIIEAMKESHLDILVSYGYDTFGMTLIEAEALGVPVLIVDPAMEEIVPRGGYKIADSPAPAAMAEALYQIITRADEITNMSMTMLSHRHEVRISETVTRLERVFDQLIAAHRSR